MSTLAPATPLEALLKLQPLTSAPVLPAQSSFQLFGFQKQCVKDIYQHIRANQQRILLIADCGAGKTAIATHIIRDAILKAKNGSVRCLFLVDLDCLVKQAVKDLRRVGIEAGVLQAKRSPASNDWAIIVSLQTLQSRLKKYTLNELFGKVGVVIADEAHDTTYRKCYQVLQDNYLKTGTIFLGLTATPERMARDQYLGQWFDVVVEAPQSPELIRIGRSVPCRAFHAGDVFDLDALKIGSNGDYQEGMMGEQASQKASLQCVVRKYQEMAHPRPTLAFCPTVDSAKKLAAAFNEAGVFAEWQVGDTKTDERDEQVKRINQGKTLVLCTVGTATKGFDCPIISCVLFVRATKSRPLFFQCAGRGARAYPDKTDYLLLDFGGNLTRRILTPSGYQSMGNPTGFKSYDIGPKPDWKRRKDEEGEGDRIHKECPECGFLNSVFVHVCTSCGYEFNPDSEAEDDNEADDIELVEYFDKLDRDRLKFLREQKRLCFAEDITPNTAIDRFLKKWGYIPPKEWHFAAILGKRHSKKRKQAFLDYLSKHAKHQTWYNWHYRLEFGFGDRDQGGVTFWESDSWREVLGVSRECDRAEAKQAYRDLALQYHPDTSDNPRATEMMQIINRAWDEAVKYFGG